MRVSGYPSLANGEGRVLSRVTSPLRDMFVCDPQMPGNHWRGYNVTSWLRPDLLCSEVWIEVNYAC